MPESNDKNNDDVNFYADDTSDIEKVWVVDWNNKFKRTSSGERTNYQDALKIFQEKAKEGKNTILYEVQKSISNGKMLKMMPVLNSKHIERDNKLLHDKKESTHKKDGGGGLLSSRKSRFLILLAIVVGFIIIFYIINSMTSDGTVSSHHMILEILEGKESGVTLIKP
jgi:hypothetical protein